MMTIKSISAVVTGLIVLVLSLIVPPALQAAVDMVELDPAIINGFGAEDIVVNPATNRVYTVNTATNSVSVVNGATGALLTNVQVGNIPSVARVNKVTNKLYVINAADNTVSVLDGTSNTVIQTVSVGVTPYALKVNEDTNRVYVLNFQSASVSVIDGTTDTLEATVAVGLYPTGIGIIKSAVSTSVYVANAGTATISVIDGTPGSANLNTVTATIPLGLTAWDRLKVVANDTIDKIYVVNRGRWNSPASYVEASVVVIDANPGNTPTFNTVTGTVPVPGVYRATRQRLNEVTGYLYLVADDTDIVMINMATNTIATTLGFNDDINDLAVNKNTGRIYAAVDDGRLVVIDGVPASGTFHTIIADPGTYWIQVITVNKTSNHIFASISEGGVLDFDGVTNTLVHSVSTGGTTYDLALDSTGGRVWVAHTSTTGLKTVDTTTHAVTDLALGVPMSDVLFNPNTNRLYGASLLASNIKVIDTVDLTEEADIALTNWPVSWEMNSQTNRLYLVDGNQLKVVDGNPASPGFNDFILPHVTLGADPEGIGINENTNHIYVGEETDGVAPSQIAVINGATNAVVTTIEVGIGADVIAVNQTINRIYTSNNESNSISVIDGDPASPGFSHRHYNNTAC